MAIELLLKGDKGARPGTHTILLESSNKATLDEWYYLFRYQNTFSYWPNSQESLQHY